MKNGNTPAFGKLEQAGDLAVKDGGLTKREYFAAMAMQGLCAGYFDNHSSTDHIKDAAIEIADELLAELERTNEPD